MNLYNVLYVVLLGIVEGITEWLPISSTGHLLIVEKIFKSQVDEKIFTDDFNEMFTVVIQLGAILAVVGIFFRQIWPFSKEEKTRKKTWSLWKKILIASIPAAVIGIVFDDVIDRLFFNPITISITLIVYGAIFIIIELAFKNEMNKKSFDDITLKTAFLIGISQVLAMMPGTSRSGITIITGLLLLKNRSLSAEFSFLLSIPVMVGASGLKIVKFLSSQNLVQPQIIMLLIGMLVAYLVSMMVVKWLLKYLKKKSFKGFAVYRIALGFLIILGVINGFF